MTWIFVILIDCIIQFSYLIFKLKETQKNNNKSNQSTYRMLSVVPVGGGLPVMIHFSVTSEPQGAVVSSRGLSNLGPSAGSSSAER